MMLDLHSTLRVVFTIYATFWVTVVVGLLFVVGVLLKKGDRSSHPPDRH